MPDRPSELEMVKSEVMSIKRLLLAPSDAQKAGGVFAKSDHYFRETPHAFIIVSKAEHAGTHTN
jgi:hypothetical protein